jgi:hypothetical protein
VAAAIHQQLSCITSTTLAAIGDTSYRATRDGDAGRRRACVCDSRLPSPFSILKFILELKPDDDTIRRADLGQRRSADQQNEATAGLRATF